MAIKYPDFLTGTHKLGRIVRNSVSTVDGEANLHFTVCVKRKGTVIIVHDTKS
jgi:hypothetical protein